MDEKWIDPENLCLIFSWLSSTNQFLLHNKPSELSTRISAGDSKHAIWEKMIIYLRLYYICHVYGSLLYIVLTYSMCSSESLVFTTGVFFASFFFCVCVSSNFSVFPFWTTPLAYFYICFSFQCSEQPNIWYKKTSTK